MAITDYDSNAANNTAINGVNIAEGCSPAGINNAIREVMADLAGVIDLIYPVGSTIMSTSSANPGLRFPGTTWAQVAEGRAIVGVGDNGESTWAEGDQRGSETHTLTVAETPAHTHAYSGITSTGGAHSHIEGGGAGINGGRYSFVDTGVPNSNTQFAGSVDGRGSLTSTAGSHAHTYSGTTTSIGSGGAHNNIQPSEAFYVWERTA
ncbi:hypothetical protein [Ruegeria sp. HKCCA4812]|uniref:phage baseplate protein n=1 Tax=Ruegeria sp. HKCCA4812 TaxID=2682993 RepID=UPI001489DC39|nr:hypothetical protein [Ruegeria sp. HKCCA4812]